MCLYDSVERALPISSEATMYHAPGVQTRQVPGLIGRLSLQTKPPLSHQSGSWLGHTYLASKWLQAKLPVSLTYQCPLIAGGYELAGTQRFVKSTPLTVKLAMFHGLM